ncbi:MAG: flagellar FliJ family protein [Gammaproteobacteria bacterium]|nr:flagellar FliJ family protein [Gammaproteobacteria bacterium]
MRRRKSLHSLQRLAEFAADAASRDVGTRLRALRVEEERLRQVDGFIGQYDGLALATTPGLTIGSLKGRRDFGQRLRDAAGRQRQAVEDSEQRYREQVERWREARAQALALQRFNERIEERRRDRRERREQATLDDIARQRR